MSENPFVDNLPAGSGGQRMFDPGEAQKLIAQFRSANIMLETAMAQPRSEWHAQATALKTQFSLVSQLIDRMLPVMGVGGLKLNSASLVELASVSIKLKGAGGSIDKLAEPNATG